MTISFPRYRVIVSFSSSVREIVTPYRDTGFEVPVSRDATGRCHCIDRLVVLLEKVSKVQTWTRGTAMRGNSRKNLTAVRNNALIGTKRDRDLVRAFRERDRLEFGTPARSMAETTLDGST